MEYHVFRSLCQAKGIFEVADYIENKNYSRSKMPAGFADFYRDGVGFLAMSIPMCARILSTFVFVREVSASTAL